MLLNPEIIPSKLCSHLNRHRLPLNGIGGKSSDEKLDAVAEALDGLLTGLEQMTKQANQSSAISLTNALLNERSDRQILKLVQSQKTRKSR